MNKKGFLRILEAIIAIIIVFTTVILIIPKVEKNTGKISPDLELTANAILKEVQNNDQLRKCVLDGSVNNPPGTVSGDVTRTECIGNFIKSLKPSGATWNFAMKICTTTPTITCEYYSCLPNTCRVINNVAESTFINNNLPKNKDVYSKDVTISVQDPAAEPTQQDSPTPSENKVLKLYFWTI